MKNLKSLFSWVGASLVGWQFLKVVNILGEYIISNHILSAGIGILFMIFCFIYCTIEAIKK